MTGGLGFIGSHCAVELHKWLTSEGQNYYNKNIKIVILDNLSNCSPSVLERINKILADYYQKEENYVEFVEMDILDLNGLTTLF